MLFRSPPPPSPVSDDSFICFNSLPLCWADDNKSAEEACTPIACLQCAQPGPHHAAAACAQVQSINIWEVTPLTDAEAAIPINASGGEPEGRPVRERKPSERAIEMFSSADFDLPRGARCNDSWPSRDDRNIWSTLKFFVCRGSSRCIPWPRTILTKLMMMVPNIQAVRGSCPAPWPLPTRINYQRGQRVSRRRRGKSRCNISNMRNKLTTTRINSRAAKLRRRHFRDANRLTPICVHARRIVDSALAILVAAALSTPVLLGPRSY